MFCIIKIPLCCVKVVPVEVGVVFKRVKLPFLISFCCFEFILGPFNVPFVQGVVKAGHIHRGALVAELELAQVFGGGVQLLAGAFAQNKEYIALVDLLPLLDHDGADLPGGPGLDLVAAVGFHCAGAAHLGGDGAVGDALGSHLSQGVVHKGVGEEGKYQHHRQKDNGGVFDPSSVFHFDFHELFSSSNRNRITYRFPC